MDCSEFRRRLLIDPESPELKLAANARVCPDAPARLTEALTFEHELGRAIQVEVPADLVERVLAATREEDVPPLRVFNWRPLALAASLLLSAAAGLTMWLGQSSPTEQLILASVEHIAHEPFALTRTERVPQPLVSRMFDEAGLNIDDSALSVSFLSRCPIGERRSVHMVMAANDGPVTVLYVPGEDRVERMDTRSAMVAVRTMPFGDGALVLLAESDHDFDRIESAWHGAVGESGGVAGGL